LKNYGNCLKKNEEHYIKDKKLRLDKDLWNKSHGTSWACIAFYNEKWNNDYIRFQLENHELIVYGLVFNSANNSNVIETAKELVEYSCCKGSGLNSGIIYLNKKDIPTDDIFAELCKSDNDILKYFCNIIDELLEKMAIIQYERDKRNELQP